MDTRDFKVEMTRSFRLNEPAVIADIIDGEIVIMNLERGSYYGLDTVGADIWRMVMAGKTGREISDRVAAHFGVDRDLQKDVSALIAKMLEHDLLIPAEGSVSADATSAEEITAGQYNPPDLAVYSDMKDLLAFDPPLPTYEPTSDN